MRSVQPKLLALGLMGALAAAAASWPLNHAALAAALGAYAALLYRYPDAWLLVLPALLPVLDLAPWTGRFFFDELDLLLLLTAAAGYWRLGADDARAALPRFFLVLLALAAASAALAAWIGATPLAPLDANAFSNYSSRYNSLRVAKGIGWALLLLPLMRRAAGPGLAGLERRFVPGMLLGLALASLAVVWERAVFPGLFNFASDYRPTAPFSAMHTGGAALDAYLALAFPFVAAWLLEPGPRRRLPLALLLLLLGSYAGLALFSRDIYLAYGCSGAVIGVLALLRGRRRSLAPGVLAACVLALAVIAYALSGVFASSGYRGLAAALMLLAAAMALGGAPGRLERLPLAPGAALLLAGGALFALFDKGAYLGFGLAAGLFALGAGALYLGPARLRQPGLALAAASFPALALGAALVALHWGGAGALAHALFGAALACGIAAANRLLPQPVLRLTRASATLTVAGAIAFATAIPVASSYYLGTRFATVGDDFALRLRHWDEALAMMDGTAATSAFGMGLGRYPDAYAWNNTHGELPGSYSYLREDGGNQFLRLGAPQYANGYGEVLRMLQHVDLGAGRTYRLALDVRSAGPGAALALALCERWLLYPQNCVAAPLRLGGADGAWQHYDLEWEVGALGAGGGTPGAPVQLELANVGSGAVLDIDRLSLRTAAGDELIRNGGFEQGNDHWFFSSDRNHFPWHVKNFAVNTYFEQGWLGVAAMGLLLLYALGELALRGLHGEAPAAVYLAALAGFLVVGLFDSLFDVPRLALAFYLVLFAAMMRPLEPLRRRS